MTSWRPPRGRVLVLAAHPDDETLGCGGAIAYHRRRDDEVVVVFVTNGAAGDPRGLYRGRDYAALRRSEARKAARVLGVRDLRFWDYEDGRLSRSWDLRDRLAELLGTLTPAVVYRPSVDDPHPDHRALALRFEEASRDRSFLDCRYEIRFLLRPDAVLDVSAEFETKARALRHYRSQLRYFDYLGLAGRQATLRSLFVPGSTFAEAYRLS